MERVIRRIERIPFSRINIFCRAVIDTRESIKVPPETPYPYAKTDSVNLPCDVHLNGAE
jgi:hypothetical protein